MSDPDVPSSPPPPEPSADPEIAHGIYSTGLIVIHTRDEFMLDFLSGLDVPKLVGRVLATPAHAKRMIRALMENLARYEHSYGALPPQVENSRAKPGQVKDIYSQLQISTHVLGGTFSNSLTVKHAQDVFVMDFIINFPPVAKVNARFSPARDIFVASSVSWRTTSRNMKSASVRLTTAAPSRHKPSSRSGSA